MAAETVQTVNEAGKACRADCGKLLVVSQNGKRGSSRSEYCNAGCRGSAHRKRKAMAILQAIARIEADLKMIRASLVLQDPPPASPPASPPSDLAS